jgi:Family of unknown function (DUF6335)
MKPSKPREKARPRKPRPRRRPVVVEERQDLEPPADPLARQAGTGPRLSAGDVDADWKRAESTGEETVGGSVATPDQDIVDEIGRALGVEHDADAPVHTSDEILRTRDRLRWHLERDAADAAEGRARRRR